MDLKDLVYLDAIGRHRSLTRAAKEVYITQPALSNFLRNLEDSLKVELFQRSGNTLEPTPAGRCCLEFARRTLAEKETLERQLSVYAYGKGQIRVGVPFSRTERFVGALAASGPRRGRAIFRAICGWICSNSRTAAFCCRRTNSSPGRSAAPCSATAVIRPARSFPSQGSPRCSGLRRTGTESACMAICMGRRGVCRRRRKKTSMCSARIFIPAAFARFTPKR